MTYPDLERTLVREAAGRMPRACASVALAALVYLPTWTAADGGQSAVTLFCLISAASITAITVIGELAWAVPLSFGLLAIVLNNSGAHRIARIMDAVLPPLAYAVLALAILWYTARGPRRFLT
jgi:mannose/fructose/N-acetylgalactosamine-specific phosphotransferase system component IID